MARYGIPGMTYLDSNGKPLSAGKLYFYESGTLDEKATFSDNAETIVNTNPVILDAAGRQPDIFFSGQAKIVIQNYAAVQIDVADPIGASVGDSSFTQWVVTLSYSVGDIVTDASGNYFVSLVSANVGNNPATSPAHWMELRFINVYNPNFSYSSGDVAFSAPGLYYSLVGTNVGNTPASSPAQWRSFDSSFYGDLTPRTATFTAVSGRGIPYFIDTSGGAFTMELPASPSVGDRVPFVDYSETFGLNNLTIARNGQKIMNLTENMLADVTHFSGVLMFTADRGWVLV